MKWFLSAAAGAAVLFATPALATTEIDFDDGVSGTLVGANYAGQGVTFTNAEFTSILGRGIRAPGSFQFGSENAISGTFLSLADIVSIRGLDVGQAGARLDVFDVGGLLLGFSEFFGPGVGVGTNFDLSVSAIGISRFALYQPLSTGSSNSFGDGMVFDNLSFKTQVAAAVPEPATWAMMLLGFGFVGGVMRIAKRRQKVSVSYA